jgi:hypothetical protein
MYTYSFLSFMVNDNISCVDNYPVEEYLDYLIHFNDLSFEYDRVVKCLRVELTLRSNSRVANVFLHSSTLDDLLSDPDSEWPKPIGHLTFTLWNGERPEIKNSGLFR